MKHTDAFEVARNSAGKTDPIVTRYLHSAVLLDRRGKIIATGRNYFSGKSVISDDTGEPIAKTIHAEVNALSKVNIRRLDDCTIINYGRTNVASILARPCENCWAVLKKLGLRKVFYTVRSDIDKPLWREEYF